MEIRRLVSLVIGIEPRQESLATETMAFEERDRQSGSKHRVNTAPNATEVALGMAGMRGESKDTGQPQ